MGGKKDKHYRKLTEKKVKEKYKQIVDDAQGKFISDILAMPFKDPWEWSRKQIEGEV
ncbi:MAG: hypothetical protein KAT14_00225 [Candidatus Marinimicrobia bacterium]|nr:hypothetical protein [Candidatus Neomarinimicrobiota bacterium]